MRYIRELQILNVPEGLSVRPVSQTLQCDVSFGSLSDIDELIQLDASVYEEAWRMSPRYIADVMRRNPETWRVLRVDGQLRGCYALLPLTHHGFSLYLDGSIGDDECIPFISSFEPGTECSMILDSIIVDQQYPDATRIVQRLLLDLRSSVRRILNRGVIIKDVGCIAVSNEGARMARILGLKKTGIIKKPTRPDVPGIVYRSTSDELTKTKFWSRLSESTDSSAGDLCYFVSHYVLVA